VFTIAQGSGDAVSDGWTTYSSRRWKTNVETPHAALDQVLRLRGVSYDSTDSGKNEIGVIAEEVGAVVPEVLAWNDNAAQGVDYSRLVALLIESTKQQQKEIQRQREQLRVQQGQSRSFWLCKHKLTDIHVSLLSRKNTRGPPR
jgi:Chaperone of endosialidase